MKFDVIVADPPWPFSDRLKMSDVKRGAEANYDTMTISDIQGLAVKDVCNPAGAVLCLWVPGSLLKEGLATMEAWGFQHKQTLVWVKTKKYMFERFIKWIRKSVLRHKQVAYDKYAYDRAIKSIMDNMPRIALVEELAFGMGRLFRQSHELCLVGISNNGIYKKLKNKSQRSVIFAENLKHSSKPEALQDSLETMFPKARKLEMFARRVRPDWTCLGNEIDGKDIRDALSDL